MNRILIAGIGNIFFGDDAFGVEVAQRLMERRLPEAVRVMDFGIRAYDLAYALMDGYDAIILVDATPRGHAPGTLYLIEPDLSRPDPHDAGLADAHSLNPLRVLHMVQSMGSQPGRLYLVGCEPAVLETEDELFVLSERVQAAVPQAVDMIESLLEDLLAQPIETPVSGLAPARRERSQLCITPKNMQ